MFGLTYSWALDCFPLPQSLTAVSKHHCPGCWHRTAVAFNFHGGHPDAKYPKTWARNDNPSYLKKSPLVKSGVSYTVFFLQRNPKVNSFDPALPNSSPVDEFKPMSLANLNLLRFLSPYFLESVILALKKEVFYKEETVHMHAVVPRPSSLLAQLTVGRNATNSFERRLWSGL